MIFAAVKPAIAGFAVISISLSRPISRSISVHSSDVRWSHQIIDGLSTSLFLSKHNKSVHLSRYADSCNIIGIYCWYHAFQRFNRRIVPVLRLCSAQPFCGWYIDIQRFWTLQLRRFHQTIRSFVPDVPKSILLRYFIIFLRYFIFHHYTYLWWYYKSNLTLS